MRSSRTSAWLYSAAMPRGVTPCWSVSETWPPFCSRSCITWTQPALDASCMAVHFFRHTCSTRAPPAIKHEAMWWDLALTAEGRKWVEEEEELLVMVDKATQNASCQGVLHIFCEEDTVFWPKSRGDSFLLLVVWGEAPCSSRSFTFSTKPALTARVRKVSPSAVFSSRVRLKDAGVNKKSWIQLWNLTQFNVINTLHIFIFTYINLQCEINVWAHLSPYSTISRTASTGWTAALCRGYQPFLSTCLKAAGNSQSSCSAHVSPAQTVSVRGFTFFCVCLYCPQSRTTFHVHMMQLVPAVQFYLNLTSRRNTIYP